MSLPTTIGQATRPAAVAASCCRAIDATRGGGGRGGRPPRASTARAAKSSWSDEQKARRPVREYLPAAGGRELAGHSGTGAQGDVAVRSGGSLDHARAPQGVVCLQRQSPG